MTRRHKQFNPTSPEVPAQCGSPGILLERVMYEPPRVPDSVVLACLILAIVLAIFIVNAL